MARQEFKNYWQLDMLPTTSNPTNTTVYWHGFDSEERFRQNPKPGYTETSITYSFNSHGFRTKEFDIHSGKKRIVFLGCSHTEGVGLRQEDTWVHKVAEYFTDYDCYNMGVGGTSGDTAVRFLYNCSNLINPSIVFILWPDSSRFDIFRSLGTDECKPDCLGPWSLNKENMFMFDEAQSYQNFMRNKAMIEILRANKGFTLVDVQAERLIEEFRDLPLATDYARDDHWAPSLHTYTANKFLNLYEFIKGNQC